MPLSAKNGPAAVVTFYLLRFYFEISYAFVYLYKKSFLGERHRAQGPSCLFLKDKWTYFLNYCFLGPCDRRASHLKSCIKRYINEGNNVTTAQEMKAVCIVFTFFNLSANGVYHMTSSLGVK